MKLISTDNYGSDYPDEKFLCWVDSTGQVDHINSSELKLLRVAQIFNQEFSGGRFYKVVDDDYELIPGFEP